MRIFATDLWPSQKKFEVHIATSLAEPKSSNTQLQLAEIQARLNAVGPMLATIQSQFKGNQKLIDTVTKLKGQLITQQRKLLKKIECKPSINLKAVVDKSIRYLKSQLVPATIDTVYYSSKGEVVAYICLKNVYSTYADSYISRYYIVLTERVINGKKVFFVTSQLDFKPPQHFNSGVELKDNLAETLQSVLAYDNFFSVSQGESINTNLNFEGMNIPIRNLQIYDNAIQCELTGKKPVVQMYVKQIVEKLEIDVNGEFSVKYLLQPVSNSTWRVSLHLIKDYVGLTPMQKTLLKKFFDLSDTQMRNVQDVILKGI